MTVCHIPVFDETLQKTHEWMRELEMSANLQSQSRAYTALRAVLHTLRDRLCPEEAADLAAQLPMLVRGFYYEGWSPARTPTGITTREAFLAAVDRKLGPNSYVDAESATLAVFKLLSNRISRGEVQDIRLTLPRAIRELWPME